MPSDEERERRLAYSREYYRQNRDKWQRTPEDNDRRNAQRRERYHQDSTVQARAKADAKAYREAHPERRILTQYKLDAAELEMLTDAGCAICKTSFDWPGVRRHIDHDHKTGETRGVLCQSCNLALGHLHDDPVVAAAALRYLLSGGAL